MDNVSGGNPSVGGREANSVAVQLFHGLEIGVADADDDDRQRQVGGRHDGLKKMTATFAFLQF